MDQSSRGQTAVLGVVLLVGIVAIGSVGLMVYAGQATSDVQQQTENERVEQAFVELSQRMATTSTSSDASQSIDLSVDQRGAIVKKDTGNIRIEGGDVNETLSIGSIEYEADDGTRLAYQAGAVFRETGNQTRIVSAPPIHYDEDAESLSFPVVTVSGETELNAGDVTISHEFTDPVRNASIVENDSVRITVTSKYYRGWEAYFERQAGEPVIRDVDHENQTVTAELGYRKLEETFGSGVTFSDALNDKHDNIDEAERGSFQPLDPVIYDIVNSTENGDLDVDRDLGTVDGYENLSNGTHIADKIDGGHLEFDLSEGNATLIVDGDIIADGSTITVTDYEDNNTLKIYATGDYDASNTGDVCIEPCGKDVSGKVIQLYGTSEMQVDFGPGGKSRYEGLLYAASDKDNWEKRNSCSYQVCLHSNPNFYGSIIASSVQAHAAAIDFEYDENLRDSDIDLYPEGYALPPQLTYLNVAKHEVDVKNS